MWIQTFELPSKLHSWIVAQSENSLDPREFGEALTAFARGVRLSLLERHRDAIVEFDRTLASDASPTLRLAAETERWASRLVLEANDAAALERAQARLASMIDECRDVPALRGRVYQLSALVELRGVDVSSALPHLDDAAKAYTLAVCDHGLAQIYDMQGQAHFWLGRFDEAALYYSQSLVFKVGLGDAIGTAITTGNLAHLALQLGKPKEAQALAKRHLEMSRAHNDPRGQARALTTLSMAFIDQNLWQDAKHTLNQVLELSVQNKFGHSRQLALKELATIAVREHRTADAAALVSEFAAGLPSEPAPYDALMLRWLRSLLTQDEAPSSTAVTFARIANDCRNNSLQPLEIDARLAASQAFAAAGDLAAAGREALIAWKRAVSAGLLHLKPRIRELLERSQVQMSIDEEFGRAVAETPVPDGYQVFDLIGRGGYGTVHRAFDYQRGRMVALKRVDLSFVSSLERRQELIDSVRVELETAERANHEGLAKTLAIGRDHKRQPYVVQEYYAGRTLRQTLSDQGFNPETKLDYLNSIAQAVTVLHKVGIVHRDIKPENVIIQNNGKPIVIDFGISAIIDRKLRPPMSGTLFYCPPYAIDANENSFAQDVYALAMMSWEWLSVQNFALLNADQYSRYCGTDLFKALSASSKLPRKVQQRLNDAFAPFVKIMPANSLAVSPLLTAYGELRHSLATLFR